MSRRARLAVSTLVLSAAGLVGILTHEGYTERAVIPTKGDVPTIGFGTTAGVKLGDRTDPVRAVTRALKDVGTFEGAIKDCVRVPLTQGEYDVYVDLAYNVGPFNFCRNWNGSPSTLVARLNAGDYVGACDAILAYKYAAGFDCSTPGNKRCAGLWTRRQASHARCLAEQTEQLTP